MSDDVVVALVLCALAAAAIVVALIFAVRQKVYYDKQKNSVTGIEVPLFGKLRTNTPAIALCFLGVVFGYFAYDLTKGRLPTLVKFQGKVTIHESSVNDVNAVLVGVTSGSWFQTATPNQAQKIIDVEIPVPDSWPSYSAYAFAMGVGKTRPVIIGTNLENPNFKLSLAP